ncbi:MAG: bifunctional adenosylcobinamide kinase/adenosylcobinamide-phosphate guanylyltransferase [Cyclobacteriaceae bacterium]|nr:bifunctional adenosylcobinamide kinase/adenosylcobinamide-phosphate guanylyltransferase [Cyclobacteriaceae bacterium]
MIYFITGGQRSGKSSYGQKLALELSQNPVYLATSRIWDEDHKARIERHKSDRDDSWTTIEEEKFISNHDFSGRTVLMDCVTLWLTNFFTDNKNDVDLSLREAKAELTKLFHMEANFIIISNEIGMGLHAETEVGRKFTDLQGWMNQFIAGKANKVYLMVSGIPVKVK